ncbi:MAG: exopolysaccharide biosynthesis protein [Pseudanabaenaceae cyanobacterium]
MAKLSQDLSNYFFGDNTPSEVCLDDLLQLAGERVFGFLFVLLSLPSALPIPAPGYSTPFGVAILLLGVQLLTGAHQPWLPERWRKKLFTAQRVQKILKLGLPWLQRIEQLSSPRWSIICEHQVGIFVIGIMISLMAISMIIPIPGTNTLPAMGIFVTGFGLLEKDGIISLIGLVLCLCGLIVSTSIIAAVIWGGISIIDIIKKWLRG